MRVRWRSAATLLARRGAVRVVKLVGFAFEPCTEKGVRERASWWASAWSWRLVRRMRRLFGGAVVWSVWLWRCSVGWRTPRRIARGSGVGGTAAFLVVGFGVKM